MSKNLKKVLSFAMAAVLCFSLLVPIKASATNFIQNWNDGGNINFSHNGSGGNFSVSWSNAGRNNFVVGQGWSPGSSNRVMGYNVGAFQPATNSPSFMTVYGWVRGPLAELYIVEIFGGYRPSGTYRGTVSSDGGQYTIYHSMRYSQPSIDGTATFPQYWSVRNSSNSIGQNHNVTVANHVNAWNRLGMSTASSWVNQTFVCEGFNSPSGYANATTW